MRRRTNRNRSRDLDRLHHAHVFMGEHVTVHYRGSGEIHKTRAERNRRRLRRRSIRRESNRIGPVGINRLTVDLHDLERIHVNMERVADGIHVEERPFLDTPEGDGLLDGAARLKGNEFTWHAGIR